MWDTGLLPPPEAVADLRPATLAPSCDRDDWDRAPQELSSLEQAVAGGPMCGSPRRLKRMRSMALASVAVPTVERGSEPIRCWSTMIAAVSPSRTSTSGRAWLGIRFWTNEG